MEIMNSLPFDALEERKTTENAEIEKRKIFHSKTFEKNAAPAKILHTKA